MARFKDLAPIIIGVLFFAIIAIIAAVNGTSVVRNTFTYAVRSLEDFAKSAVSWEVDLDGDGQYGNGGTQSEDGYSHFDRFDPEGLDDLEGFRKG